MKKIVVVPLSVFVILVVSMSAQAQVPKEGTTSGLFVWNIAPGGTKALQIDKDRSMTVSEMMGLFIGDSPECILHNASFRCVSYSTITNGFLEDKTMCTFVRPDSDQIFVMSEGSGQLPAGVKRKHKILGGTGKFTGIQGEGTGQPGPRARPAAEGTAQGYGKWTVQYKLP